MSRRFVLRPRWGPIVLACLFFGACAALFVYLAATDERGVVIERVIALGPSGARTFYGVLAVVSGSFVVVGILGIARLYASEHAIVIDEASITIPPAFWRKQPTVIRFTDVRAVGEQSIHGQVLLTLEHTRGKSSIAKSHTGDDYAEIVRLVTAKLVKRS